jgi:sugar lactone lactonase YvrE
MKALLTLALFTAALSACQPAPISASVPPALRAQAQRTPLAVGERFLCAIEPGDKTAALKVKDLVSGSVRSVFVPGRILSIDGVPTARKLYISSQQGTQQPDYSLYEVNVETLAIRRIASFSQAGLRPTDFVVDGDMVHAVGTRQNQGVLLSYNLKGGGWQNVVYGIQPGSLEWGRDNRTLQAIAFDDENITRTHVDLAAKRITGVQTYAHGVPFGNNIGVAAPRGDFYYTLHQLQGQVEIFAFDISNGATNRLVSTDQILGVLYSSAISRDGRFLYATVDDKVHRYELIGTQLRRLPPIVLRHPEARFLALSPDNRTLYVSHEGTTQVSQIQLSNATPTVAEVPMPGISNELFIL